MSITSDDSIFDLKQDVDDIEEEEENLLQIRKQLLTVQQFRLDQERKNSTISSLRSRIDVLEDQKSTLNVEIEMLRSRNKEKENVEKDLTESLNDLETTNDQVSLLQLENGNLQQELKSVNAKYVLLYFMNLC